MTDEEIEMAKWTRKFINSLPNSSFAVIEPDYLSGKTDNKNARHLPYKDKGGKVDLPHLRNALARMNQIKPVTKSISTEELRAKAKKKLEAAAKKHLPSRKNEKGQVMSEEFILSLSNGKLGKFESIDSDDDTKRVMKFELMDNAELYNGVRFTKEALQHQMDIFNKGDFLVTHGMNHTGYVQDQLGKVMEMEMEEEGDIATVFITSEHYKETPAQQVAETLYKQGLLDTISGGWRASIAYNTETEEYEVYKPMLREVSSTPVPAKTSAKKIENVCMDLQNQISTTETTEEGEEDNIPMEELDMPEKEKQELQEPSPEGDKEEPSVKDNALIEKRQDTLEQKFADLEAKTETQERTTLLQRAADLELAETEFEGQPNAAIEFALQVASKVKKSTLRANDPDIPLGGEGTALEDGSPEMLEFLNKNIYMVNMME